MSKAWCEIYISVESLTFETANIGQLQNVLPCLQFCTPLTVELSKYMVNDAIMISYSHERLSELYLKIKGITPQWSLNKFALIRKMYVNVDIVFLVDLLII